MVGSGLARGRLRRGHAGCVVGGEAHELISGVHPLVGLEVGEDAAHDVGVETDDVPAVVGLLPDDLIERGAHAGAHGAGV